MAFPNIHIHTCFLRAARRLILFSCRSRGKEEGIYEESRNALSIHPCALLGLLGCTNGEEIPSASGVSSETASEEGGPVVICADESFREDLKELISYLAATGNETEYELLVLPDDTEDREPELTRLRTEIMAGEGPDAFILDATIPGTVTDSGEPLEALFPNVEKSMYSHLFLDLEEMVQNSEIIELENCNQTVMDVGVAGDSRFLLPLTYTFSTVMVDKSALEDPDYTFSTLDELLQSDQETLKGLFSFRTFKLFPNCLGVLADYEGQNLLVTQESLQKAVEQGEAFAEFQDEQYSQSPAVRNGETSWSAWMELPYDETEYTVFPIPNPEGGVTAAVTAYAAINRNAAHPQEAFALIEQLFREELVTQTGSGFEVNGYHYCSTFSFGVNYLSALPVKEQLLLDYIEPNTQEPPWPLSGRRWSGLTAPRSTPIWTWISTTCTKPGTGLTDVRKNPWKSWWSAPSPPWK